MTHLKKGDKAPDFSLPCDANGEMTLTSFKGRPLVIFFYPKDNTPGCTAESCEFRDAKGEFEAAGAAVIGVSKDLLKSHGKFRKKQGLNFPLLSDENGTMCEDYGVWGEKSMLGHKYMGIVRSTFLIDAQGVIRQVWDNVKVSGHVDEVLGAVRSVAKAA